VAGGVAGLVATKIVTNGEGPLRSRRCQNGTTRNTLSSGMLTTRFLFPKFFPKKFGHGAGPPTGNFGNGLCAGPVLLHPAPPFVQMKNTPGGSFPRGGFPGAAFGARDRSSAAGYRFHAWVCHVLATFDRPLAGV